MDMEGRTLHTWRFLLPGCFRPAGCFRSTPPIGKRAKSNAHWWRRIHLYPNGDLLAIFAGLGVVKIDKDSKLLWSSPLPAHHDLEVQPNGDIYVLTRVAHMIPRIHPSAPILEDFISVLGPDGAEKQRVSLLEAFEKFSPPRSDLRGKAEAKGTSSTRIPSRRSMGASRPRRRPLRKDAF